MPSGEASSGPHRAVVAMPRPARTEVPGGRPWDRRALPAASVAAVSAMSLSLAPGLSSTLSALSASPGGSSPELRLSSAAASPTGPADAPASGRRTVRTTTARRPSRRRREWGLPCSRLVESLGKGRACAEDIGAAPSHPSPRAQFPYNSGALTPVRVRASTTASTTASTPGTQGAAEPGSGARSQRTWPRPVSDGGSAR